jgi:hypothetical protein
VRWDTGTEPPSRWRVGSGPTDHVGMVERLLPACRIPALRAQDLEPHWWGGHTTAGDEQARLTSVQIGSGDPEAAGGPRVRVSTGEAEPGDTGLVPVGSCEMEVDGEALPMQVLRDDERADGGEPEWPRFARGRWRGYEVQVQATGVPLEGLRLTGAGDLTQYLHALQG